MRRIKDIFIDFSAIHVILKEIVKEKDRNDFKVKGLIGA